MKDRVELKLPARLDFSNAIKFCRDLPQSPKADIYVLNARNTDEVDPFAMLLIASALRRFRRARIADGSDTSFVCEGHRENSFAGHMGFWKACGVDYGRAVGGASGGDSYLPISCFRVQDLLKGEKYSRAALLAEVESECSRLATVMSQGHSSSIEHVVTYSLREIVRNCFEHAGVTEVWYCAQYWRARHRIEVAVLDDGIGIRAALRRNPKHQPVNDVDAIRLAIQEGVTGTVPRKREIDEIPSEGREYGIDPSFYDNSGYGLFVVSQICRAAGSIVICSGDRAVKFDGEVESNITLADHPGTAIRLVLHPKTASKSLSVLMRGLERKSLSKSLRMTASFMERIRNLSPMRPIR